MGSDLQGGDNPLCFNERVEQLAVAFDISGEEILPIMTELMQDKAHIWLRNNHKAWSRWAEFKQDRCNFFLSPRYFESLNDDIRKRV